MNEGNAGSQVEAMERWLSRCACIHGAVQQDGCLDRNLREDGGFVDGCMSEKQIRWLLENKWLK